jgi:ATP-dependent exoDNAse (exonuclease V) alpha subunit
MLSISDSLTVSGAEKYYDRDNYYLESPGYFYGGLADQLGIEGTVTESQFKNLLRGYDPTAPNYETGQTIEIDGQTRTIINIDEKNNVFSHIDPKNPGQEAETHPIHTPLVGSAGKEDRRAGIDMTFSAPKSVSILSYQDDRIQSVFNEAVHEALEFTEKTYTQTRHKNKATVTFETTGNAAFAIFNHATSRELDPQLHAHCVMMNLTRSAEKDKYMSMDYAKILQNNLLIGQFFRNSLAAKMQGLGYSVKVTDRKKGFFEVAGMPDEILNTFSKRREQVVERLNELKALKFKDLPENQLGAWAAERIEAHTPPSSPHYQDRLATEIESLKNSDELVYAAWKESELAVLATTGSRVRKKNVTKEYIINQMNTTLNEYGTSLSEMTQKVQNLNAPPREKTEIGQIISAAVQSITKTESAFTREIFLKMALKSSLCDYTYNEINAEFDKLCESGQIIRLQDEYRPNSGETPLFTTINIKTAEQENIEICKNSKTDICVDETTAEKFITENNNILHAKKVLSAKDDKFDEYLNDLDESDKNIVRTLRTRFQKNKDNLSEIHTLFKMNQTIKDFFYKNGQGYTPGQINALKQMVATKCQFSVIQGDAGTGKSFSMMYAKELLESQGFSVRGLAPTGKATDELAKAAKLDKSLTIDKFILKWEKSAKFRKQFVPNKECFVVDESGMVGSLGANKLLKIAKEINAKVVFVGDRKQFAAVSAGKFFSDLQDKAGVDMAVMEDVMRQKTTQTKGIVKAISSKSFDVAFNYLLGYNKADIKKSKVKNYQIGQRLLFDQNVESEHNIPADTNAEIIDIKKSRLTIRYTRSNGQTIEANIDPRKEHHAYTVYSREIKDKEKQFTNCISEISDEEKRLHAVANDYLNCLDDGKDALVITATNDDRKKLNTIIREALTQQNKVQDVIEYDLLEPKSISNPKNASEYQIGQVLELEMDKIVGKTTQKGKSEKKSVEITAIDQDTNIITVKAGDITLEIDPYSFGENPPAAFNKTTTMLGINEKIAFLKNAQVKTVDGRKIDIRNGQLATITSLDKDGNVEAVTGEGDSAKKVKFNINNEYNKFTTAYALSSHKSQGMTVDKIIWHANTTKEISTNSFYVAITRCKNEVSVYTDNTQILQKKARKEQEKYSTVDRDFEYDDGDDEKVINKTSKIPIDTEVRACNRTHNKKNSKSIESNFAVINKEYSSEETKIHEQKTVEFNV